MYFIDKVTSKRLIISAYTEEEMDQLIAATDDCNKNEAYRAMLQGMRDHQDQYLWYTNWKICLQQSGLILGSARFMGPPNDNHEVEIDYDLGAACQNQGYRTEALEELCAWAFRHADCFYVQAETSVQNTAAQEVLAKNHFRQIGAGEERLRFELEKPKFTWLPIYLLLGFAGGLYLGIAFDRLAYGLTIGLISGIAFGLTLNRADQKARIRNTNKPQ
ncbi:MAG: GNAT family N-acetyltransferase [Negativicutes bacterium]|nr:GNAT family N-acetyltransferase [Negativicutes bacterium]